MKTKKPLTKNKSLYIIEENKRGEKMKMTYHKIPKIDKSVCTAEQKIAYNLAFSDRIMTKERYEAAQTKIAKDEIIQERIHYLITYWQEEYSECKYNTDAIFAALQAGFENYINRPCGVLWSFEEVGHVFPANYL